MCVKIFLGSWGENLEKLELHAGLIKEILAIRLSELKLCRVPQAIVSIKLL